MSRRKLALTLALLALLGGVLLGAAAAVGLAFEGQAWTALAVIGLTLVGAATALLTAVVQRNASWSFRNITALRRDVRRIQAGVGDLASRQITLDQLMGTDGPLRGAVDEMRVEAHALSEAVLTSVLELQRALEGIDRHLIEGMIEAFVAEGGPITQAVERTVEAGFGVLEERVETINGRIIRATEPGGDADRLARSTSSSLYSRVEGMQSIQRFLRLRDPLPPFGNWAIRSDLAAHILRTVCELKPTTVLDVGSGTSTVLLAAICRELGTGHVTSIEHDAHYGSRTQSHLRRLGLEEWATIELAPLVEVELEDESYRWYDLAQMSLPDSIDAMLIDGPPGTTGVMARYPALPLLRRRIAARAVVWLDDADRPDERRSLERWQQVVPDLSVTDLEHASGAAEIRFP